MLRFERLSLTHRFRLSWYTPPAPKPGDDRVDSTPGSNGMITDINNSQKKCIYCNFSYVKEYNLGHCQPFQDARTNKTFWAHWLCVMWTPETSVEADGSIVDLSRSVHRSRRSWCRECNKRGGGVGCNVRICKFTAHYACAVRKGCCMHESVDSETSGCKYEMYCPEHFPSNASTPCSSPSRQSPPSSILHGLPLNVQAPPVSQAAQCAHPHQACQSADTTHLVNGEENEDCGVDESSVSHSYDTDTTTPICPENDSETSSWEVPRKSRGNKFGRGTNARHAHGFGSS